MIQNKVEYSQYINELFNTTSRIKNVTFQVTENCNLACSYCYQINKTVKAMDFETAKKIIDQIFESRNQKGSIWYKEDCMGLVFEFIGGEPLLQIDLIDKICNYIESKMILVTDCDWPLFYMYSFSTNGTLYFSNKVQEFLEKYRSICSMSVTVDGNKELHDKCRVFKDSNQGSYDLAIKAALNELEHGSGGTKLTFAPENISYVYDGIINMIELGFIFINCNVVFESGWTKEHAKEYYYQLKRIADYLIEHKLYDSRYIRVLDPNNYYDYKKADTNLENNFCGVDGNGTMIAIDYQGNLYPCIRFTPSSLGTEVEPLILGNINDQTLDVTLSNMYLPLVKATTKNLSSKECLNCPIASGCAWCTGLCYQEQKDFNHRTTYHCLMHVAEACAAKYLELKTLGKSEISLPIDKVKLILSDNEINFLNEKKGV